MTMVVDASVALRWFLKEEGHEAACSLLSGEEDLIAPDTIASEVTEIIWFKERRGEITREHAEAALEALPAFLGRYRASAPLLPRAFALAERLERSVSDGLYLACAEAEGAALVTADASLKRAAIRAGCAIPVRTP